MAAGEMCLPRRRCLCRAGQSSWHFTYVLLQASLTQLSHEVDLGPEQERRAKGFCMMPSPNLLTIPREIRDQIYSFFHEARLLGPFYHWEPLSHIHLRVYNAPFIDVLLTHSRLREEYLESDSFRNRTCELIVEDHFNAAEYDDFDEETWKSTMLCRARNLTVVYTNRNLDREHL